MKLLPKSIDFMASTYCNQTFKMKIRLKILWHVLAFLVFSMNYSHAQTLTSTDMNLTLKTTGSRLDLSRYEEIKGSPYLYDSYKNGFVNINNKEAQAIKNIRFNCLQNQLEYQIDELVYTPISKYHEFSIEILNDNNEIVSQQFRNGFEDELESRTYFEVLYDGKTKLLKKHLVRIDEYSEPLSYRKMTKFTKVSSLYIYKTKEKKLVKIKAEKKAMLEVLQEKHGHIKKYIEENKLKLKSESELIETIEEYDRW